MFILTFEKCHTINFIYFVLKYFMIVYTYVVSLRMYLCLQHTSPLLSVLDSSEFGPKSVSQPMIYVQNNYAQNNYTYIELCNIYHA